MGLEGAFFNLGSVQISDDTLEGGVRGVCETFLYAILKKLQKSVRWGGSGAPKKVSSDI